LPVALAQSLAVACYLCDGLLAARHLLLDRHDAVFGVAVYEVFEARYVCVEVVECQHRQHFVYFDLEVEHRKIVIRPLVGIELSYHRQRHPLSAFVEGLHCREFGGLVLCRLYA
jgi:hypothetical protein